MGQHAPVLDLRPRGDLFVIYNHNLREIEDRWRHDASELLVKLPITFRR